jgi:glutamate-1-semialdehyde 2,1-aminomutase
MRGGGGHAWASAGAEPAVGVNGHRIAARLRDMAHHLIPGGCHTYAKGDDQYPVLAPGFIARGLGCRVWDTDGRSYIEYGMGNRAVGLGHAYPAVVDASSASWCAAATSPARRRSRWRAPSASSR